MISAFRRATALFLILGVSVSLAAQEGWEIGSGPSPVPGLYTLSVEGVLDSGLGILPASPLGLFYRVSGGNSGSTYYRVAGLDFVEEAGYVEDLADYRRWFVDTGIGIRQYLSPALPLQLILDLRSRVDWHVADDEASGTQAVFLAGTDGGSEALSDANGGLRNSILAGLSLARDGEARVAQAPGYRLETSVEYAPAWLANTVYGAANFLRVNVVAEALIPLAESDELSDLPWLLTLGLHGIADEAIGLGDGPEIRSIPLEALAEFGGTSPRSGLGGTVRGVESGRFDAARKLAASAELRLTSGLLRMASPLLGSLIVPGILVFTDIGYYDRSLEPSGNTSGVLLSSGGGLTLNVLDLATLVFGTEYLWNERKLDGEQLSPFVVDFSLHF